MQQSALSGTCLHPAAYEEVVGMIRLCMTVTFCACRNSMEVMFCNLVADNASGRAYPRSRTKGRKPLGL